MYFSTILLICLRVCQFCFSFQRTNSLFHEFIVFCYDFINFCPDLDFFPNVWGIVFFFFKAIKYIASFFISCHQRFYGVGNTSTAPLEVKCIYAYKHIHSYNSPVRTASMAYEILGQVMLSFLFNF